MTIIDKEELENLLKYVQTDERICPLPVYWTSLWELLPECRQKSNGGWEPPLPLILAAWHDTTSQQKRERLEEHIKCAAEQGILDKADRFIRDLTEEQWFYGK